MPLTLVGEHLTGRQAINLVVHHDVGQIDVAAHGVNEMVAADAETVAVAAGADDFQLVVAQLDAGGHRQRAAVQRVHAVGVDVARQVGGAADAADDADLMRLQAQLEDRCLERGEDGEIAAAGAPVGVDAASVSVLG